MAQMTAWLPFHSLCTSHVASLAESRRHLPLVPRLNPSAFPTFQGHCTTAPSLVNSALPLGWTIPLVLRQSRMTQFSKRKLLLLFKKAGGFLTPLPVPSPPPGLIALWLIVLWFLEVEMFYFCCCLRQGGFHHVILASLELAM